jgi:hypothetical protein
VAHHSIENLEEYVLVLDVFAPLRPDIIARLQEIERRESASVVPTVLIHPAGWGPMGRRVTLAFCPLSQTCQDLSGE